MEKSVAILIGEEPPKSIFEMRLNEQTEVDRFRQECLRKAARFNRMF